MRAVDEGAEVTLFAAYYALSLSLMLYQLRADWRDCLRDWPWAVVVAVIWPELLGIAAMDRSARACRH